MGLRTWPASPIWIAATHVFAACASAQTFSFAAAPAFSAGVSPTSVAAGYFNNDVYMDLAVTNQNGVSILISDRNGGFLTRVDYALLPSGSNPQFVAVGSFDHRHEDLAVVNQSAGTVAILMGNGDGTFQVGNSYTAGVNPRMAVIADLNLDGNADLAVVDSGAGPGTGGVSVLLGNGDGTFQMAKFYAAGTTPVSLALGYFNNDAAYDLAVANVGSDDISVLLGKGDGSFQTAVSYHLDEPGLSVSPTSVAAGDFDGNGKTDLAVATPSVNGYVILPGQGDGTFGAAVRHTLDDPNFVNNNNAIIAADMNGDSKLDLVLVNYSANHLTLLFGAGDGTFPASQSYAAGPSPTCAVVADFDNDQMLDLAISNFTVDGVVTLIHGTGGGALKAPPLYRSSYTPQSLAAGDLDGDGILDLVAASPTDFPGIGSGVTMLGNGIPQYYVGNGTFKAPISWTTSVITSIALGDFNGDGKLDMASTSPTPGSGNVSVWLGNGDGTFQTPRTYSAGTTPVTVVVADLNGDHKLDLVVGNENSNNVSVLLGNGDGTFQAAANYSTPATGSPTSVVVMDFNGDGIPDIAAAISGVNATSVALLLGNGGGTFRGAIPIPTGFHSPGKLQMAAGNFNGDNYSDLAVTDGTSLSILLGNATGAIPTPLVYTLLGPGAGVNGSIAAADFNGDSNLDLAVTTRDGLFLLAGNGDGSFQAPVTYDPFLGGALVVGDFDGSGTPDIVTADSGQDQIETDTVAVLLNLAFVPGTITVNTVPTGLPFTVYSYDDGVSYCAAAPCAYAVVWGEQGQFFNVDINPPIIPGSTGTRYALSSFSDSGVTMTYSDGEVIHSVEFPSVPFTETVNFKTQYQATAVASPAIGGATSVVTSSPGGFYDAGAEVTYSATPSPGYTFDHWFATFGSSPTTLSCPLATCAGAMYGPATWTAYFNFTGQRCDLNSDLQLTVADAQSILRQALGLSPAAADLNRDGAVNIADTQILINAVRGLTACPL